MEFGPEIKVDGIRPEWLKDDDEFLVVCDEGEWSKPYTACEVTQFSWQNLVSAIRLPANHSHYATPTPDERAVAPELVSRLVELAKRLDKDAWDDPFHSMKDEARAIVAALEPVDPMLIEARQVVADLYTGGNVTHLREQALSGEGDEWFHTKVARAALARGRQLEKEGK